MGAGFPLLRSSVSVFNPDNMSLPVSKIMILVFFS